MDPYTVLTAPEHLRIEVAQVLRRYARDDLGETAATAILRTRAELELDPTSALLPRVWDLRHGLTCYDAVYLAAAELRRIPLLTGDAALLAHADRARCRVVAID